VTTANQNEASAAGDPLVTRRPSAATVIVTAGRPPADPGQPLVTPVELTSTFHASDERTQPGDPVYGRYANRSWRDLEDVVGQLEGGQATAFASGMAAIAAVMEQVPAGGVLVIPRGAYSNTTALARSLDQSGRLHLVEVDVADTGAVLDVFGDGANVALLETPTNPLLDVADLPALAEGAKRSGVLLAIDNTFATPLLQRPIALGADVVIHSATKYLSGHTDVLLGIVVIRPGAGGLLDAIRAQRSLRGAIPGPFEAWLALRGLRTLDLRVQRAGANAAELARRLAGHPAVKNVRHPSLPQDPGHERASAQMQGFGAIISIELTGGADAAERVCSATRLWAHATSLGGVESTLERRRRHATESQAVPDSLIRLSVGIEDVEDLWADLDQALTG
jgi:cystathionine gamma-synthase